MTDEELAAELRSRHREVVLAGTANAEGWSAAWLDVARRARELCGPTPEERAVIEAGLLAIDRRDKGFEEAYVSARENLWALFRTLRAAREPKPRYYEDGTYIRETAHPRGLSCGWISDDRERAICVAALNAAEKK